MTGADDTVTHEQLFKISEMYPSVEWGILMGREYYGKPRFPSKYWLKELGRKVDLFGRARFSCHLCGSYVSDALFGIIRFIPESFPEWEAVFNRVQLNTHGEEHAFSPVEMERMYAYFGSPKSLEFIYQFDGANPKLMSFVLPNLGSVLFDLSHGAGLLPESWPQPIPGVKCGYAGGLGPHNIQEQLDKLNSILPQDAEIWIDMETHVRTKLHFTHPDSLEPYMVSQFDLEKVVQVLKICEKSGYMKNSFQQA